MEDILERLNIETELAGRRPHLQPRPPGARTSKTEADIAEEVLRMYGYEHDSLHPDARGDHRRHAAATADAAWTTARDASWWAWGYYRDRSTISFISPKWLEKLGLPAGGLAALPRAAAQSRWARTPPSCAPRWFPRMLNTRSRAPASRGDGRGSGCSSLPLTCPSRARPRASLPPRPHPEKPPWPWACAARRPTSTPCK